MSTLALFRKAGHGTTAMSNQPTVKSGNCVFDPVIRSFARRARFMLACFASIAYAPALTAAQPDGTPPRVVALSASAQQFFAAVRANFAVWDLNHDGKLTRAEIEINMQNPHFTGDAAAALSALKRAATHVNHLPDTRAYTLKDIDAMERRLLSGQKLEPNFVGYFTFGLRKLRETPRHLFSEGLPRLNAIRQIGSFDCYFLATAGALAQVNPQAIVRLITPGKDGQFTITFPSKPPLRIPAPTDAEVATYMNARDGIWLSVLEKAYAIVRIKAEPAQAFTKEPLDSVGFRSGNPDKVVELLTGHPSRKVSLPADSHHPADEHLQQELRSAFRSAFREHRAVMLSNSHHSYRRL
jgi:hypothetical protein